MRVKSHLRWNRAFYTTQLLDSRVTVISRSGKDNHHHLGLRVKMFSNESQVGFSSVISEFKHCRLKHLILQTEQSITSITVSNSYPPCLQLLKEGPAM